MLKIDIQYKIKETLEFIMDVERINLLDLSKELSISRNTINEIIKKETSRKDVCEKIYSYLYKNGYRLNKIKEELLKESKDLVLFHGSKYGLSNITIDGSRNNCDFGNGFYLGETYNQALAFICENEESSIYSFTCDFSELNIVKFECNLNWMLAICYFRGSLENYKNHKIIKEILNKISNADVIVAPIADNKMFYIMSQFSEGEINADVALHSLSASSLGLQYILKTEKALNKLNVIEKYYVSKPERNDFKKNLNERSFEIDTKLKVAKREYKNGLYIEEIFK